MQPLVRKMVNELSVNILDAGRKANPFLMKLVGRVCDRQILTLGNVPFSIGDSKEQNIIKPGCSNPTFGFDNVSHVDYCDMLSEDQLEEWSNRAEKERWHLCSKILKRRDFCLPTNCGYQFAF